MNRLIIRITALFLLAGSAFAGNAPLTLLPAETTPAYAQYSRRPSTELSKLIYLIDRFKETALQVLYDGYEYTAPEAARYAKNFLAKNYKEGSADSWVKNHCYRTEGGSIIYLKDPAGELRPLQDVLLTELETLQTLPSQK